VKAISHDQLQSLSAFGFTAGTGGRGSKREYGTVGTPAELS